jgi:hypothetical protein
LDVDDLVTAMMIEKDDRSVASKESVDSKEALPTGKDYVCFWARLFGVIKIRPVAEERINSAPRVT